MLVQTQVNSTVHTCVSLVGEVNCDRPVLVGVDNDATTQRLRVRCGGNDFYGNTITTPCSEDFELSNVDTLLQQQCRELNLITNCVTYEFQDPTLLCRSCQDNFWLDSTVNQCKSVTVRANCIAYSGNADTCLACEETHILSPDQLQCLDIPTGAIECEEYDSEGTTCLSCKDGSYLTGGECIATSSITNCTKYAGQF